MIESARERLLFVSYAVYRVRTLGDALLYTVNRGVALTLVLEPSDFEESDSVAKAMGALHPQLADKTEVLVWPADKRVRDEHGRAGVLHAKCAVADGKMLFLSSANLTESALTANMELGALIRGGPLPGRVEEHFERLRAAGVALKYKQLWTVEEIFRSMKTLLEPLLEHGNPKTKEKTRDLILDAYDRVGEIIKATELRRR